MVHRAVGTSDVPPRREEPDDTVQRYALRPAHKTSGASLLVGTSLPAQKRSHPTVGNNDRDLRTSLRTVAMARLQRRGRRRGALRSDQVSALWRDLLTGRWSLVDRFDDQGRRVLIARRNDSYSGSLRTLTEREQQIVGYIRAGVSIKLISFELGLAPSTVATHVANVMSKLGVASRLELIGLLSHVPFCPPCRQPRTAAATLRSIGRPAVHEPHATQVIDPNASSIHHSMAQPALPAAPEDLSGALFHHDGQEYLVLSYSLLLPPLPTVLTPAEREVLAGVLQGKSNAEIALLRGTSLRTVANQIASIFRKLGVGSRAELIARFGHKPR